MKSELQQLITELESEIINYDQNRSRAQHVSTLKKIARNMQKELDRMPEFDIIVPVDRRDKHKIKPAKTIVVYSQEAGDNHRYLK